MTSWTDKSTRLETIAKQFDRTIKLKTKDNLFSRIISWILFIISFGKLKRDTYLKRTATTIGHIHYYPKEWSFEDVESVLPHEARHTWQNRRFGLGIHPMVGLPIMAIIYFLLPIPIYFAYGRFYVELDADRAKYRYILNKYGAKQISNHIITHAIRRAKSLSSPTYIWAMKEYLAHKMYKKMALEVINEYKT